MKKQIGFYILFMASLVMMLVYHGCSDLETDLVAPESPGVHGAGWLSRSSANFHGTYIANHKWDLSACKTCHANDYTGGATGVSCYKCHQQGPEECTVCHGGNGHANPPKALNGDTAISSLGVGVHVSHLDATISRYGATVRCDNGCHTPVIAFSDSSHIGPNPDGIADINFGALAKEQLHIHVPNPQWNRSTGTCSDVYCHGAFDGGNINFTPTWTNPSSVVCGSCHGDSQTGNPRPLPWSGYTHNPQYTINDCVMCHFAVVDSSGNIIAPEKHINGIINFGQ